MGPPSRAGQGDLLHKTKILSVLFIFNNSPSIILFSCKTVWDEISYFFFFNFKNLNRSKNFFQLSASSNGASVVAL